MTFRLRWFRPVVLAVSLVVPAGLAAGGDYLVFVDAGEAGAYLPAAQAAAGLHEARLRPFDPSDLKAARDALRRDPPRFVVFVLPPQKIDVDLCHRILVMATEVDEDPFVDFEYGFVTGRDGEAARRFVGRIGQARKREFGRTGAIFGSWEGRAPPAAQPLSVAAALEFEFVQRYLSVRASEEAREKAAREALTSFIDRDLMLFYSHGYPDRMVSCFRASDLRAWEVRFPPVILINCACYNGAPGRWYHVGRDGRFEDRGVVPAKDSVALALLDSGIAGYVAGIDPWHGPLANQLFWYLADDGMRLGEAAKRMADRLALEFLPGRIRYPPTRDVRFTGEGRANRRRNGAGMILYGDPALAPFKRNAGRRFTAKVTRKAGGTLQVTFTARPLLSGMPGPDFMLAQARLMDYYSVKTANYAEELRMELYRVVPRPDGVDGVPRLRVTSALSGSQPVKTEAPQVVPEDTPWGRFLHVRVPLAERLFPPLRLMYLARNGVTITLEAEG
jgi:hypothetical protein